MKPILAVAALALAVPAAAPLAQSKDIPVRVRMSYDVYAMGDRAKVHVRSSRDGYLVVLRVDTEGRVRVLYPLEPGGDASVRANKEFEVRGRGGREAFTVSEQKGAGLIFAARAETPFNFSAFTRGQHWNLDALVPADSSGDPEAAMLNLVDRMSNGTYEYDALPYAVDNDVRRVPAWVAAYDPWYQPMFGVRRGVYYSSWPWLYGPRYGFHTSVLIPVRPFNGRRR